MPLQF